jgi:hypothetical protein
MYGGPLTVNGGLVLGSLLGSERSEAVILAPLVTGVFNVITRVPEPSTRFVLAGRMAFASEQVIPTKSVMLVTTFQFASTALTVTANGFSAVCADGLPVLPVCVPGAADSPGSNNCSFENAFAGSVVIDALVPVTF